MRRFSQRFASSAKGFSRVSSSNTAAAGSFSPILRSNSRMMSAGITQHRNTPESNIDVPFEWTEESLARIKTELKKFPTNYKRSAVLACLYIAQEQGDNWLPLNAMNKVAETLQLPPIQVYEVATFYTMYNRTPVGKYHIQHCGTTPCMVRGAEKIKAAILKNCNMKEGETSEDGLFHLTEVECLGACVNAPMFQVNNELVYENLTEENVVKLLDQFRNGETPKVGPQTDQRGCEGPEGKGTLLTQPPIVCRDFDALKIELEAEEKKQQEEAK